MAFPPKTILAAFACSIAFGAPAFADSIADSADLCLDQLEAESTGQLENATYKFKGARGSSVKKLTFKMRLDGETEKVVCKVKRGEITEIEWPEIVTALKIEDAAVVADNS